MAALLLLQRSKLSSSLSAYLTKSLPTFSSSHLCGFRCSPDRVLESTGWPNGVRSYHDGRPRGPLWRGKKLIGKEALFVIQGMKRFRDDEEKLNKFVRSHVTRLLKLDMVAVLSEFERQEEVSLSVKMFEVIQKQDWYKPDVYLYKDLIMALAKCKKMEESMKLWESMRKEGLYPDSQTYTEVIRGFLRFGSPADAMNVYEDMKSAPDPPDELPFRILLKGLIAHPLLRNRVKQDFEELFPERHVYDPPDLRCPLDADHSFALSNWSLRVCCLHALFTSFRAFFKAYSNPWGRNMKTNWIEEVPQ